MIKKEMFIFVNSGNNNNKFCELTLLENYDVIKRYGRVGTNGVTRICKGCGISEYNKIRQEKIRKGYNPTSIDLEINEENLNSAPNILDIAMKQIKTDKEAKELIERLVQKNIHNITSNTKITYDIKTGYFETPLGIIKREAVNKALSLLNKMKSIIKNKIKLEQKKSYFIKLNEDYFTLIPTKIKDLRDFSNLLINEQKIQQQVDICYALLDSIEIIETEKKSIKKNLKSSAIDKIFDTSVYILKDKKEISRIEKYFEKSKNILHGSYINNSRIENIYKISLKKEEEEFRNDLSNQMELFHGTRVGNLLSILKSGLLMPKVSPGATTGYMFGQGLYFSNQSTKSLNYCDGMYWNNSKKENRIYLLIADVAMGNYQVPKHSTSHFPSKGFDSYWAKPRISGIKNDEMIVFNNNQIKLKYILEILI